MGAYRKSCGNNLKLSSDEEGGSSLESDSDASNDGTAVHDCGGEQSLNKDTSKDSFVCELCNFKFTIEDSLKVHYRNIHAIEPFRCRVCTALFPTSIRLDEHACKQEQEQDQPKIFFVCDLCKSELKTRDGLQKHFRTAHTQSNLFGCHGCGTNFSSSNDLSMHACRPGSNEGAGMMQKEKGEPPSVYFESPAEQSCKEELHRQNNDGHYSNVGTDTVVVKGLTLGDTVEKLWRTGVDVERDFTFTIVLEPKSLSKIRSSDLDIPPPTRNNISCNNKRKYEDGNDIVGDQGAQRTMKFADLQPSQAYGYVEAFSAMVGSEMQHFRSGVYAVACPWCTPLTARWESKSNRILGLALHIGKAHKDFLQKRGLAHCSKEIVVALWGSLITDCTNESRPTQDLKPSAKRIKNWRNFEHSSEMPVEEISKKASKVKHENLGDHLKHLAEAPKLESSDHQKPGICDNSNSWIKDEELLTGCQGLDSISRKNSRADIEGLGEMTAPVSRDQIESDITMDDQSENSAQIKIEDQTLDSDESGKDRASRISISSPSDLHARISSEGPGVDVPDSEILVKDEPLQGQSPLLITIPSISGSILADVSSSVAIAEVQAAPTTEIKLESPPKEVVGTNDLESPHLFATKLCENDDRSFR